MKKTTKIKTMGCFIAPATLALGLLVGNVSAQTTPVLWQTETGSWITNRSTTLTGDSALTGGISTFINVETEVGKYTDWRELSRVVIRVLQPAASISPTINTTISVASGTSVFSNSIADNRAFEETKLEGVNVSIYEDLLVLGAEIVDYNVTKYSSTWRNVSLESPAQIETTIGLTQESRTLFDSDTFGLNSTELASVFAGTELESINFLTRLTSGFAFQRTSGTEVLTAQMSGINSGTIIIEYYVIPEPGTMAMMAIALGSAGGLALIRRRKR